MITGNNISLDNGLLISVDWIEFTDKTHNTPYEVISMFGLSEDDFIQKQKGAQGYKRKLEHCSTKITILYDGNEDMGIHMSVPGSSIAFFLDSYKKTYNKADVPFGEKGFEVISFDSTILADVLKDIIDYGNLTRFDIAIDDKGCKYYTVQTFQEQLDKGLYTSRFKTYEPRYKRSKKGYHGHTVYLGSRKSEIYMRVYDKKAEQNEKRCSEVIDYEWTRWEIELKKERANYVALLLIGGAELSNVAMGIIGNYLRLIVRDNANDSRCSTAEMWESFLYGISKIKLSQPIPEKTLDKKREWLKKQVSQTIAAIYEVDGSYDFIVELIELGSVRMSVSLRQAIYKEVGAYDIE